MSCVLLSEHVYNNNCHQSESRLRDDAHIFFVSADISTSEFSTP